MIYCYPFWDQSQDMKNVRILALLNSRHFQTIWYTTPSSLVLLVSTLCQFVCLHLWVGPSRSLAQILLKLDLKPLVSQLEAYVPSCWAFHFTRRRWGGWEKNEKKRTRRRRRKINQTQTWLDWVCRSLADREKETSHHALKKANFDFRVTFLSISQ